MKFTITLKGYFEASPEKVFDYCVLQPEKSLQSFTGFGFIPAIKGFRLIKGDNKTAGSVRIVKTSDGGEIEETLDSVQRPNLFEYSTKRFQPPFNFIVKAGHGVFRFIPAGNGTRQEWTYSYELTSFLVYPLAFVILGIFFRKAMQISLENNKIAVES